MIIFLVECKETLLHLSALQYPLMTIIDQLINRWHEIYYAAVTAGPDKFACKI